MRKIIVATVSALALAGAALTSAQAAPRHHGHHHGGFRGAAPWIAGGMALGILGAGIAAHQYHYNNSCWRERRAVRDQWGNIVGYRNIRVCD